MQIAIQQIEYMTDSEFLAETGGHTTWIESGSE